MFAKSGRKNEKESSPSVGIVALPATELDVCGCVVTLVAVEHVQSGGQNFHLPHLHPERAALCEVTEGDERVDQDLENSMSNTEKRITGTYISKTEIIITLL